MESNIHITRDKNKPNNLSLPNHKFKKHINTNKRYQNIQKKPQNPQNPSLSNNNLLYTSYQRKGYNGLFDPSLSGNNNFLIIKNIGLSPNQNSKNILIDKKSYTKSNRTEISKSQLLKNSHKNQYQNQVLSKKIDNKKNNVLLESNHNVKYDNIGFKEVKYKNKFEPKEIYYPNNNLIKSYQQLNNRDNLYYKPSAENLGFFNDNLCFSYNPNIKYSLNYEKQKIKQNPVINNSEKNRQNKFSIYPQNNNNKNINNNNKNINNNELMWSYDRLKSNNLENREIYGTIEIKTENKVVPIIKNDYIFKKNKNDDFIPKNHLSVSYNQNYNKKNKNFYDKSNLINNKNNLLCGILTDNINNKYKNVYKNITSNGLKKNTLFEYYKGNIKKSLLNNQIGNNYIKSDLNEYKNGKNKIDEKYIKNISKIQSAWRGAYVRELMSYYWSLSKFKDLLDLIINNHAKKNFFDYMKALLINKDKNDIKNKKGNIIDKNNKKENIIDEDIIIESLNDNNNNTNKKEQIINDNNDKINNIKIQNDIKKLKMNLTKKEEDFDNLLKDYNNIINKFSEFKKNKEEKKTIKKNHQNTNINKEPKIHKDLNIDKNDFIIINNTTKNKIFDNIQLQQEKKEDFNIIQEENNQNINTNTNIKLRSIKQQKENKNKINYNDYLNHFNKNLNIINNEKIMYKKSKTNEENEIKDISKLKYNIINYSFSLINNEEKKNLKEICFNDQISIINNYSKPQTILDNDSVNKSNINENNDMTTITSGKDIKENKINYIPENQSDLNMELRGTEKTIIKSLKEYVIEEHNNSFNIINNFNKYEFNKDLLNIKNEILLNILTKNTNNNINNNNEENNDINNIKNINIYENERFCLIKDINNKKIKYENNNLVIENNENIILEEEEENQNINNINKNENNKQNLLGIFNNYDLYIKAKKIKKCDKTTEITEELNKVEPTKHSEIIFKGINIKKEEENKCNNLNNNIINITNDIDKDNNMINNENEIILKSKKKDININKNYNKINEIEKGDGLEINPYELQKTQNNTNNIFISYENKIEMLNNKESIYKEKAKINMMKIILPIKIKTVLKQWIKKNVLKILINNLKKISFVSHLSKINDNYKRKYKKNTFEKIKEFSIMMKYKKYYLNEIGKNRIKSLMKKYLIYKWNIGIKELAKLIASNKNLIINKK